MLMPGYLLLYHPAVSRLKELIDAGELGDVLYLYGNRQNLGQFRRDENALWSIGSQDLSMILHLIGEEPVEAWARGESFLRNGIEDVVFSYLRFPSGVVAHMHVSWLDPHKIRKLTVVGRDKMAVFDDMEPDRKLTVYDKGPVERPASDWQVRVGDIHIPKLSTEEPLRRECAALPRARRRRGRPARRRRARASRSSDARAAPGVAGPRSGVRPEQIAETAVVYPGTVIGEGCVIGDHAVVGKQPALSPRSTAAREELPPLELGAGTIVSAGAIVFAGTRIGERVIVGDQACVRERCEIGDDVVIGRGSLVENDTTIGALTKIQANAYVTAYSTLEDEVFIAPGVITTNDNFMGRTEKRHELRRGPTIRRGARVGGGAVLCPAVEIGEEAYVGAGAVVVRDVPAASGRRRQPGAADPRGRYGRTAR